MSALTSTYTGEIKQVKKKRFSPLFANNDIYKRLEYENLALDRQIHILNAKLDERELQRNGLARG